MSVAVSADGFIARGITFRNTAGLEHQAIALLAQGNNLVFYQCRFEGYQDTLCSHQGYHFYRDCYIYGTVDFIFGHGKAVFQECKLYARNPKKGQEVVVTAQGRTRENMDSGFVFQNSHIKAARGLKPNVKVYLGRPWGQYSRTVFMQTHMDSLVDPVGWLKMRKNSTLDTLYYAEYNNKGPGSNTTNRVKWPGYHIFNKSKEVEQFTVKNFLDGLSWLPSTNVPFKPGLKN